MVKKEGEGSMVRREPVKIVTNQVLRDERTERRIMDMNKMRVYYLMLTIGSIMILIMLLWGGGGGGG